MPRNYQRKTQRGKTSRDVMQRAAAEVAGGKSVRSVAKNYGINRMTLCRFINKSREDNSATGYFAVSMANRVFSEEMEVDLANHVKRLADQYYGIGADKCRELAYEYAVKNGVDVPENWSRDSKAGRDWCRSFKERHHIACRTPEATSLARASAFNKHTVGQFFNNLASVMERYNFTPNMIYNTDETGVTTVQKPNQVLAEMGQKKVGSVTSRERGELVTVVCAVNATGNSVPPMFIFPRVRYHDHFNRGAPVGSIGCATKSGWMNEEIFVTYLQHIVQHTNCSKDLQMLLILDNHESHISFRAVDFAKDNGIVMLTLPPHTSHRLQPLDKAVYGPLKTYYNRALDGWMRTNPGKTASIYDIPSLVNTAYANAVTPINILAGFRSTGIYPFNRDIFPDSEFYAAIVSDRPKPELEQETASSDEQQGSTSVTTSRLSTDGQQGSSSLTTLCPSTDQEPPSTSGTTSRLSTDHQHPSTSGTTLGPSIDDQHPSTSGTMSLPTIDDKHPSTSYTITNNPQSSKNTAGLHPYDHSLTPLSSPIHSRNDGYTSPADILPFPKSVARTTKGRKRKCGSSRIVTDTPEKVEIEKAFIQREEKKSAKARKMLNVKQKTVKKSVPQVESSSSEESDFSLDDSSDDAEILTDSSGTDTAYEAGDYVIVKFDGRSKCHHYIGMIENIDGDDVEAKFMRKGGFDFTTGKPTFTFKCQDECLFPRGDIVKKLPHPNTVGGTARREKQFVFATNLDQWSIE